MRRRGRRRCPPLCRATNARSSGGELACECDHQSGLVCPCDPRFECGRRHEISKAGPVLERGVEQHARCPRPGGGVDERCRDRLTWRRRCRRRRPPPTPHGARPRSLSRPRRAAAMSRSTRERSVIPANPTFTNPTPVAAYSKAARWIVSSSLASPSAAVTTRRPATASGSVEVYRVSRRPAHRSADPWRRSDRRRR